MDQKIFEKLIETKDRVCRLETSLIEGYSKAMTVANLIMLKRSIGRLEAALRENL